MIRAVVAADAAAVAGIINQVIRDTTITFNPIEKSVDDVTRMIEDKAALGHGFYVLDLNGTVAGYACFGPFRSGIGYAHSVELSIALVAAAQGLGWGRALLHRLEQHARDTSVHVMVAAISAENHGSREFHATLGFVEVAMMAQVGWKFGRWHDLVLMQKILT